MLREAEAAQEVVLPELLGLVTAVVVDLVTAQDTEVAAIHHTALTLITMAVAQPSSFGVAPRITTILQLV